jgi:FKBP-type peptidyl-prolyl cis-trans isomerase
VLGSTAALLAASTLPPSQSKAEGVVDGQGEVRVLPLEAEEDLSVPQRQVLEYNKRSQRQNGAPPDFPLFVREGFDMTILASDGYQVSPEGLIYKDYAQGTGGAFPEDGQQVQFDYTAYNESAAVIDSSYRKGQPASTRLGINGLIPGFEMGIKSMKVGGKRRIVVPPDLGPPVGPSTFFSAKQFEIFDVELRSAKNCVRRSVGMFSDVVCE